MQVQYATKCMSLCDENPPKSASGMAANIEVLHKWTYEAITFKRQACGSRMQSHLPLTRSLNLATLANKSTAESQVRVVTLPGLRGKSNQG
eukprot:scaffold15014_cov18-Tisochrysis_lutea.AAC.2